MSKEKFSNIQYIRAIRSIPEKYITEDTNWTVYHNSDNEYFLFVVATDLPPIKCDLNTLVWEEVKFEPQKYGIPYSEDE